MSVSVVIPCYGYSKYLERAINSVRDQVGVEEIIVVDDHDPTPSDIIPIVWRNECQYIRHASNKGLAAARNSGIKLARSDFVLPLDADDEMWPGSIEKMQKALLENHGFDVAYMELSEYHNEDWTDYRWGGTSGWSLNDLRKANRLPYASMFGRNMLEEHGGYDEDSPCEGVYADWMYWLTLAKSHCKFLRVPGTGLIYHKHGESMIDKATVNKKLLEQYMKDTTDFLWPTNASWQISWECKT